MNRRLSFVTAVGLTLVGLFTWGAFAVEATNQSDADSASTTSTFHVTGMTCGGCEVGVRRVVKKLDGIEEVEASHEEGTAVVTYDTDKVSPEDIIAAIEELGYTAELADDEEADA